MKGKIIRKAFSIAPELLVFWVKEPQAKKKYVEALRRSSMEGMLNYYKANYPREPYKDERTFPPVKCPVLIILGKRDVMTPLRGAKGLQEKLPAAKTVVIDFSGHSLMAEAPDAVLDALIQFLSSGPGS